jgi:adenine-specific DNA-methyltransferase
VSERNGRHFDAEVDKLGRWSEDLKLGLEREIRELDREIADAQRQSVLAVMLADKLEAQRGLRTLEQKRNRKRRDLFEAQDEIEAQRMTLIEGIERQLAATHHYTRLFTLRWTLG